MKNLSKNTQKKLFRNEHLSKIEITDKFDIHDILFFAETASVSHQKILVKQWVYANRVEDGIYTEVRPAVYTIAKDIGCNEKTVDRANKNLKNYLCPKKRFKNGRQTSNVYCMPKAVYKWLKILNKLRVLDGGIFDRERLKWVLNLWYECGQDWTRFMNRIYSYKSPNPNKLHSGFDKPPKKMSLGDIPKCPSISNSLSFKYKYGTRQVPFKDLQVCEKMLETGERLAWEDYQWYISQGKIVRNVAAFLRSRVLYHLNRSKV